MLWSLTGILAVLQLLRIAIKYVFFLAVERTEFTDSAASLVAMVLLSAFMLLVAKRRNIPLSVFPRKFGVLYIIATFIAAGLLVLTPIVTKDGAFSTILLLLYSGVVVPVFEELIFRGFLWNNLKKVYEKEWMVYIVSALFFALWHLGYLDSIAFRVSSGLATAMLWKVLTGLCFGILLGAVRLKTKNCYSTMLLHGVLNIFGR